MRVNDLERKRKGERERERGEIEREEKYEQVQFLITF
jgi:hypothetical protein